MPDLTLEKIKRLLDLKRAYYPLMKDLIFASTLIVAYEQSLQKPEPWRGILRQKDLRLLLSPFLGEKINSKVHEGLYRLSKYIVTHESRSFRFFTLAADTSAEKNNPRLKLDMIKVLDEMKSLLLHQKSNT